MFTVIFGRPGCPFCVRAVEVADKLKADMDDFDYRYVDIHAEGISKADLEKQSASLSRPFLKFLSTNNTLAASLNLKLTQKKT